MTVAALALPPLATAAQAVGRIVLHPFHEQARHRCTERMIQALARRASDLRKAKLEHGGDAIKLTSTHTHT